MSAPENDDELFDQWMAERFGLEPDGRPAAPSVSHIPVEAGTYPEPEPAAGDDEDDDPDPDLHGGARGGADWPTLEDELADEYVRRLFPDAA